MTSTFARDEANLSGQRFSTHPASHLPPRRLQHLLAPWPAQARVRVERVGSLHDGRDRGCCAAAQTRVERESTRCVNSDSNHRGRLSQDVGLRVSSSHVVAQEGTSAHELAECRRSQEQMRARLNASFSSTPSSSRPRYEPSRSHSRQLVATGVCLCRLSPRNHAYRDFNRSKIATKD